MPKKLLPFAILLLAFALRTWQLASVPPGLTHDEAGHGHDAVHILKGVTLIYFTVGYGREPLFDYFNAGLIAGLGASPFTLRFSAVIWGMLALAATYRVARLCFDRNTALLALALMAVSFWPLATSRQILRSGMLPAEMALAVGMFLKMVRKEIRDWTLRVETGLGLLIAASLYTYIPARALWLMFPFALMTHYVLRITNRQPLMTDSARGEAPRTIYKSLVSSLLIAFGLASPLGLYLYQHPEAEQRLGMLSAPLTALQSGDPGPLLDNAREFWLAFFLPGHGDHFLAYTIPGRPIFDPVTALLALIGLGWIVWQAVFSIQYSVFSIHAKRSVNSLHAKRPVSSLNAQPPANRSLLTHWLLIYWLCLGLAPALITGPEALTTRIVGAQPVLYLLPAAGLSFLSSWLSRNGRVAYRALRIAPWLLTIAVFISTARDYFVTWAQSPDVRAAYQSTLLAMLRTLDGPAVISTVYPSAPHDPYIAELVTRHETRWVDGRLAMLIPAREFQLVAPASTPLHAAFGPLAAPVQTVQLLSTDLDPFFTQWRFSPEAVSASRAPAANFNHALTLVDDRWSAKSFKPGEVAELLTVWHVLDPARLGPRHPPAFKTDLNLFTHILNPDGSIFLQQDRLDAPTWDWQAGDVVIQVHQFALPLDAAPGRYPVVAGLYDRPTGDRLTVIDSGATSAEVAPLVIHN